MVHQQVFPFLMIFLVPSRPNKTSFSISWVNGCSPTGLPVLDNWVSSFGWIRWVSLLLPATSESNSFIQLLLKEIFGRSRGDTYIFSYNNFSRFHHNNFRDTMSWECVVKNDCVRSCLIELQSFPLSKLYINPIHSVLVSFPRFLLVHARRGWVKSSLYGSLCSLSMGFTAVKNTVSVFPCLNFVLPVSILNL